MAASASLHCGFSINCRMYLLAGRSLGLSWRKMPVRACHAMKASTPPRMRTMPNWRMGDGLFFGEYFQGGGRHGGDAGLDGRLGDGGELARMERGERHAGARAVGYFFHRKGTEAEHAHRDVIDGAA